MALLPAAQRPPVLASLRYREHADLLHGRPADEIFSYIYQTNLWGSVESHSGEGSELGATALLRRRIPALLRRVGARRLLDAPCGDFGWMDHVNLGGIDYCGVDIVDELVRRNTARYGGAHRRFVQADLITDPLPTADVILCRDCLVHLSYPQILDSFANFRASGATYLLTTTFVELDANIDVATGDWRPLNFCLPPFRMPPPVDVIVEGCTEAGGAYSDKSLGLWRVADLPPALRS